MLIRSDFREYGLTQGLNNCCKQSSVRWYSWRRTSLAGNYSCLFKLGFPWIVTLTLGYFLVVENAYPFECGSWTRLAYEEVLYINKCVLCEHGSSWLLLFRPFPTPHLKCLCSQDSILGLLCLYSFPVWPHHILTLCSQIAHIYLDQVSSGFQICIFMGISCRNYRVVQAQNRTETSPKSALSHLPWPFNLGSDPTKLHVPLVLSPPFLSIPITPPFHIPVVSWDCSKSLVTGFPNPFCLLPDDTQLLVLRHRCDQVTICSEVWSHYPL